MTASVWRGLVLLAVGLIGGFALILSLFGPSELTRRAQSVIAPVDAPKAVADVPVTPAPNGPKTEGTERRSVEQQAALPPGAIAPKADAPVGASDAPTLDIVRIEPNGESVIAGRSAPNASVEILRDNQPIARGNADATGQFAIVPPALPTGNSELTVRTVGPDGKQAAGKESVAVVVAQNRTTKPLVAVTTPDKPTKVVSLPDRPSDAKLAEGGTALGGKTDSAANAVSGAEKPPQRMSALPEAGQPAASAAVPVKVVSVDAQEGGRLDVAGRGTAWAMLRLYLNDTLVASGQAGQDGTVAFTIGRGVKAGGYQIRIDQVDPKTGKVEHRAQVAFAVPESVAGKLAKTEAPARSPLPAKPDGDRQGVAELAAKPPPSDGAAAKTVASPPAPAVEARAASRQATESATLPSIAKPQSVPDTADRGRSTLAVKATGQGAADRPASETPSVAAATGRPDAAKPSLDTDRRTADALAPVLPPSVGSERPAAIAETPSANLPVMPHPRDGVVAAATPSPGMAATEQTRSNLGSVFVAEISTAKITRGDSLWQISRKSYGSGFRYTVIFDANKDQIRDPDLIYPGQIFVLPKGEPAESQGSKRG